MIPLLLTVKNFMCYRDDVPPLDFGSVHVACLCGDNGHGKTALLDAITWVLWGKARADRQEELVHQGQQDMAVELEFLAQGQRYRVSRRHSRSGRSRQGTTILELQVGSEDGDGFSPITGNTVRDTEARIREIVHMDYDTFINTAFLMQGQADLFTRSTPSRRKECLAEVLDLSYYQRLEEQARLKSRDIQDAMRLVESGIEVRRQEILRKPEYEEQLATVMETLARLTPEADTQRQKAETLRRDVEALQRDQRDLEQLEKQLATVQGEVARLERQVIGQQGKIDEYQAAIAREQEIREGFARLGESREALERLDKALTSKSQLDSERARLEGEVAIQKERLTSQAGHLRARIDQELEPKARRLPEIQEALHNVALEEEKLAAMEEALEQRRTEALAIEEELERLDRALSSKSLLDNEKARLEREIAVQRVQLTSQAGQLRTRIGQELEPRVKRIPQIEEALRLLAQEEERLVIKAETLQQRRAEAQGVESRTSLLLQTNEALRREMGEDRKKFDLLKQGEAVCPLCNQPLGEEGIEHLRQEYEAQGLEKKRQYRDNEAQQKQLEKQGQEMAAAIATIEAELNRGRQVVTSRAATLGRDLEDSQKAKGELEVAVAEMERVGSAIKGEDFASAERKELARIEAEIAALGYDAERRSQVQIQVRQARQGVSRLEAEVIGKQREIYTDETSLKRDLEDSQRARDELQEAVKGLERVEKLLQEEDFARVERERLAQLDAQLSALGYDSEMHVQTREQVRKLDSYTELHRRLVEAVESLPPVQEELDTNRQTLERLRQEGQEGTERRAVLRDKLNALTALEFELKEAEALYRRLESQLNAAVVQQRVMEQQLARCSELEAEVCSQEQEHSRLADEKGIYDELAAAFGKNGIQALIIESAIPQMEDDANELLGRLTENRMHLRLQVTEGRRDSRTGLPSEEMDIKIADEVGTRSYETFSGGESFRINFALRIALSKLLARRSGAPLPILFIDEGFGSQDRVGQERLTEAIQSIQDDFQKIIVITHIEQIKEAFPVRIEVSKNGNGSMFRIV